MQNSPRVDLPPVVEEHIESPLDAAEAAQDRAVTIWVSRITSLVGGICLLLGLVLWLARPEHYRLVLVLLTIAMFATILHSYTFENGNRS